VLQETNVAEPELAEKQTAGSANYQRWVTLFFQPEEGASNGLANTQLYETLGWYVPSSSFSSSPSSSFFLFRDCVFRSQNVVILGNLFKHTNTKGV